MASRPKFLTPFFSASYRWLEEVGSQSHSLKLEEYLLDESFCLQPSLFAARVWDVQTLESFPVAFC